VLSSLVVVGLMKIVQMINCIGSGGSGTLVYNLSIDLVKRGHDVDILLLNSFAGGDFEKSILNKLDEAGVGVIAIGRTPGKNLDFMKIIFRLWKIQKINHYQFFHTHSHVCHFFVGFLKKFFPVQFVHVITVHNSREQWDKITCFLCENAKIVFCSDAAAHGRVKIRNPQVINNAVKSENLCTVVSEDLSELKKELKIGNEDKLIISVGNLRKQKNYGLALETMKSIIALDEKHRYHYFVCGDGFERDVLEKDIKRLSLTENVSLLGVRSDVANLLSLSDCFLSTSEFEGLPMAVLEALASGISCVLSPIPEHENIVAGMEGCFMPEGMDPGEFASMIISVTANEIDKDVMKQKRHAVLQKYSWENCLLSYEKLYTDKISVDD